MQTDHCLTSIYAVKYLQTVHFILHFYSGFNTCPCITKDQISEGMCMIVISKLEWKIVPGCIVKSGSQRSHCWLWQKHLFFCCFFQLHVPYHFSHQSWQCHDTTMFSQSPTDWTAHGITMVRMTVTSTKWRRSLNKLSCLCIVWKKYEW